MALTDTDLHELFAVRTAAAPADSATVRVGAVGRRVRVIRRRRVAGVSLGVVVVLLAVTGISGLFRDGQDRTAPVPAYQQKVAGGLLPRYTAGGKATAYTTFSTDDERDVTFTFTPTSLDFFVGLRCDKDMGDVHMVDVVINGNHLTGGTCTHGLQTGGPAYADQQTPTTPVHLGEPTKVHVRVVQFTSRHTAPPEAQPGFLGSMRNFQVAVAVYSQVPFSKYPLPPRPQKLVSLDGIDSTSGGQVLGRVDSRSVGPNGHGSVVATLTSKGLAVDMYVVAPGSITLSVNGTTLGGVRHWAWTGKRFGAWMLTPELLRRPGIDAKVGDRVTIGFAGSRFTDPGWLATVREGRGG
jgi:hypothetical protein